MFSRLVLRRLGMALSSKFIIVGGRLPTNRLSYLLSGNIIDIQALSEFITKSYERAGLTPDKVDTGQ